ncbi:FAD binding domain-containing protein [Luteibacter sp. NPDC031894]|uniref:FAD binding domain-containing protein n=1 Tax=Luteibacter sp. NPDC031894 TaxID=3390572 RepID=UPI003D02A4C7
MRPFVLEQAGTLQDILQRGRYPGDEVPSATAPVEFLAGGTTVLDLMKIDVMRPARLVPLDAIEGLREIDASDAGLTIGALATMADVAAHADVARDYPALAESLLLAASPQLRNMATMGGNVLQRTRCPYFRDVRWLACNKRTPGSGCAAIGGNDRRLAVLGTSEHCIANYPGDLAIALVALDAELETVDAEGMTRTLPVAELHRLPGDTPHVETWLRPGELIVRFLVPASARARRSVYVKVRDRASYDFALASAAVALDLDDDVTVRSVGIGIGGMATRPWRARDAEHWLEGRHLDEESATKAARLAFSKAHADGDRARKPELGRRTLVRALLQAAERHGA